MRQLLRRLLHQDSGDGLAEYALLIALVGICLMGIIQVFRNAVGDSLNTTTVGVSQRSTRSYGSGGGGGVRAVPGPSYGGGGGGVSAPPAGDDPAPSDTLGPDSLDINTDNR